MSEIVTVPVTFNVPKESKEVIDFLVAAVKKAKAGAPITEYQDLLSELTVALKGVSQLDDEAKSKHRGDLIAYFSKNVNDII